MRRSGRWWTTPRAHGATAVRLAVLAAGLAVGVLAEFSGASHSQTTDLLLDLVVGWLLLVGGVGAWQRREGNRVGPLMVAMSFAWFAGGVLHRGPLTHMLLGYPTGRVTGRFVATFVGLAYVDGLLESIVSLPAATILWASGLAVFALVRLFTSSGPVRRGRASAAVGAAAVAVVIGGGIMANVAGWRLDSALLRTYELLLAATAFGLTADLLWGGWSQAAVTGLVVELGDRDQTGTLRDRLARALGDRSLEIGFWIRERDEYVDETGRVVPPPPSGSERRVTRIDEAGQPLAILVHDGAVRDDPALVNSVATAARIAVSNARVQAEIRGRFAELEASRRRIVEAADRQRQRLERDVSAGPLARLERTETALRELRASLDGSASSSLLGAETELANALSELKQFARGVYPIALIRDGFRGALIELAQRSTTPVTLRIEVEDLPLPIETTAYFVCSEALANIAKHAIATHAEIVATTREGVLRLVIVDDGVGGADPMGSGLRGLADRVAALGGQLEVETPRHGGTRLEAVLPLV